MDLNGTQLIKAPKAEVWKRLNDPVTLKACLPGCEQFEETEDGSYDALIAATLGPIKARFKGNARVRVVDEETGYRIEGSGSGGVAGFGKLGANVTLESSEDGTALHYTADVQMGGKLAQLGSRLVGAVASKFLAEFFLRFQQSIDGIADDEAAPQKSSQQMRTV